MDKQLDPKCIIPHVFLPHVVPGFLDNIEDTESEIIVRFSEVVNDFPKQHISIPDDALSETITAFNHWADIQSQDDPDYRSISRVIEGLDSGESFALYIRSQNTGLMITIPPESPNSFLVNGHRNNSIDITDDDGLMDRTVAFVSTFPASQKSSCVTTSPRGLAGVFPTISVTVPRSKLLKSSSFAKNLSYLTSEAVIDALPTIVKASSSSVEVREVPDTVYVSKWLTAVLMDEESRMTTNRQVPRVIKKIRDNVVFEEGTILPFRRSGLWMTIKIVLQIMLIQKHGPLCGTVLYKMLVLKYMLVILKRAASVSAAGNFIKSGIAGLLLDMMGKVARRGRKLQLYIKKEVDFRDPISDYLVTTFDELMKESADILKALRKHLRKYWELVMEREKATAEFCVPNPNLFQEHRLNSRSNSEWYLLDYLEMKKQIFIEIGKQVKPAPAFLLRHPCRETLLKPHVFGFDISEIGTESVGSILLDFEINVNCCWERLVGEEEYAYVWTIFQLYLTHGRSFYAKDAVGYSRMVLTCLKIIHLWDKIATKAYPMLLEHPPGINFSFAEDLLLPDYEDMATLLELENYFCWREREAIPRFPSLIGEQEVSLNSFAVRFARGSRIMQHNREYLLDWGNTQEEVKLQEVHERRIECEKLNLRIAALECEYQVDRWKRTHNPQCQRCLLTKRYKKFQVDVYEHPLPTNEEEQSAVMFELRIPAAIAVLRDLLYMFEHRMTYNLAHDDKKLYGPWSEYAQIKGICTREMPWLINLLSTKKLYLESHYKSLHPTNPDSDFVKQNGYTCHYAYRNVSKTGEDVRALLIPSSGRERMKRDCTLTVQKKSPYSNLQWAIDGNRYTSNEVLAKQNECHPDMSLVEFVEFGSLRVHYALQIRNIFRALTQMSLSLKNESVYNLICQAIWQVSPRQNNNLLREAHQDFRDPLFIEELLQILGDIHMKHSNNWRDHFILLMIIQLALRIISIYAGQPEDRIIGMAVYLLAECREVSLSWSEQIEAILATMVNAPRDEIDALRIKLVEINICTALTFSMKSFRIIQELLNQPEIVKSWLSCLAKIYDNLVLIASGEHQTRYKLLQQNPTLKNLLRRVQDTGIYLDRFLQPIFRGVDATALNLFVKSHYHGATSLFERCGEPTWGYYEEAPHVYYSELRERGVPENSDEKTTLQMDAIAGGFLVNGFPVSYLPNYIEEHEDFQRAFPTKSFEVQPYQRYQIGRMITKNKYHDSYYSFYLQQDKSLIVTEHYGEEKERQLVPHRYLKGNVPFRLVENFTHWLCYKSNKSTALSNSRRQLEKIEFFYRDPKYPSKLSCHYPSYVLDIGTSKLFEVVNGRAGRNVIDIKSDGLKEILKTTQRLEHDHHVIVFQERRQDGDRLTTVELPRMGLRFNVTNFSGNQYQGQGRNNRRNGVNLISQEYRGMKVGQNQKLGTLIGLRNGLLLEDANVTSPARLNSILLVPHGTPIVHGDHDIEIHTETLRNPPFFAFEVDDKLRQLKGGESQAGWVFLSLLHGLTSSPLPDPFTLLTGTERAFQILQSGNAWSCSPYDNETLKNFEHILRLVPQRVHYPPNMRTIETVKWPAGVSPYISHDGYLLLVKKLFEDSERLTFLFPEVEKSEILSIQNLSRSAEDLCLRAYWRRIAQSTEAGRISSNFDEELDVKSSSPHLTPVTFAELNSKSEVMDNVLQISQLVHSWRFSPPLPNSTNLVQKLLLTGNDVKGIYPDLPFPSKESMKFWADLNFRDSWMDLYKLARVIRKKHLESEWNHILTFYAFRGEVDVEQLLLLHTVAVNSCLFTSIDPPVYEGYTLTNECQFNLAKVKSHFESYKMEFECYLDAHADFEVDVDEVEEFKERMQPQYEELVEEQVDALVKLINDNWPMTNCDALFEENDEDSEKYSVINYRPALPQINFWLKAWSQNIDLIKFLSKVEDTVSSLVELKHSTQQFADTSKELIRGTQTKNKELRDFCRGNVLFTIDLEELISERGRNGLTEAEWIFYDDCAKTFDREPEPSHMTTEGAVESISGEYPEFPLDSRNVCPIMNEYVNDLRSSWAECHRDGCHNSSTGEEVIPSVQALEKDLKMKRTKSLELWEKIKDIFIPAPQSVDYVTKQLISAEIYPRITPVTLLPYICMREPEAEYMNFIVNLIGCYAVQLTEEQQAARCVRYCGKSKRGNNARMYDVELKQELANPGHMNWNPAERPEWLLFEIENDLMIRETQSRVAEKMENPDEDKNALLQLNMGEGKTAVIVPLLVLSLANGYQLARVTVLKPLFHINQKALLCRIGGLVLNRRLYNFPCRRDYTIGRLEVREVLKVYKECLSKRGVVIALPEYRLSFLLKGYEKCRSENFEDGGDILGVHEWILENSRDILDESDEILHVKYQLIYTLGKQVAVGGGSLRWIIIQKLLKLVPKQIENCLAKHGSTMVEIKPRKLSQKFPFVRLLKSDCYEELSNAIAAEVINGHAGIQIPEIAPGKRDQLLSFLTNEKAGKEVFQEIFELYKQDSHRQTLLIIRGVLGCGVLNTALSKRWRVNFGVNPTGFRRMAVPFRAKDVAAEKIEFGHPDIAILLTQLSYYYSGLKDAELEQAFVLLFLQTDPDQEYQRWINCIPKGAKDRSVIECLTGVNLKDFHQRTKILYPALRKNMSTIDFWLSQVVFPQESKQFGWKIGTSPWDLCSITAHPTTGFSGTNDSKILLPKTITQRDLPELQGTNGQVLGNLLRPENNNYEPLPFGFTGQQILTKLTQSNIRVLLDVGALMLELNNEQVAVKWLELVDENIEAAVYFDQFDNLVVLQRHQKKPVSLELSTFRTRLDRCVIYLDDVHTRGTDLKIPPGMVAAVTLGKGVTKDKLVQGCMRMRKLGQGHNVRFWASQEVNDSIVTLTGQHPNQIGAKQVLEWSIENSRLAIQEGFIHWASAGVYQAQKLSSHVIYESSQKSESDLKLLAESCSLKETIDLNQMYGDVRITKTLPTIVKFQLKRVQRELGKHLKARHGNTTGNKTQQDVADIVESFGEVVVGYSEKYVPNVTRASQAIDEEQERELEHELEAQMERQNPPKVKSLDHQTSEGVLQFIGSGELCGIEKWALKLPLVLKNTSLWKHAQSDIWGKNIYVTMDFARVAKQGTSGNKSEVVEQILRPVHWFCSVNFTENNNDDSSGIRREGKTVLLLLSPFEVNHFLSLFRSGEAKGILHMFAPRLAPEQDTLYKNSSLWTPSYRPNPGSVLSSINDMFPGFLNSSLLLFSGSSYFATEAEQNDYCVYHGFCLRPRTKAEDEVFNKGGIINGFLKPGPYRKELGYVECRFQENPEALIRGIIERRYGSFPVEAHVGRVIFHCIKPLTNFDDDDEGLSKTDMLNLQFRWKEEDGLSFGFEKMWI